MPLLEMRTATVTEKGQIVIPKNIRNLEGFKEGTKIAILAFDNKIELRPLKQFNEKIITKPNMAITKYSIKVSMCKSLCK